MIDREQIGIRIAALRKKSGLSQQALAEKLGVSAQAVSKWEGGRNLPDIDMFRELAWLFHMTIDSIVEGDLAFAQKSGQKALPASVEALFPDAERRRLLRSLSTYCSDTELYNIARELSEGSLELTVQAGIMRTESGAYQESSTYKESRMCQEECPGERTGERKVSIPASLLGENTLRETAPYFAKALGEMMGNTEPGLRRIEELMRCPECGEKLSLENKGESRVSFVCRNTGYAATETKEIYGELPAPEGDVFPFENEILQWMGEYLCVSEK